MKNFVVYDNLGVILRTGSCSPGQEHVQAGEGENLLVTDTPCSDTTHRVIERMGRPALQRLPARPSDQHDLVGAAWRPNSDRAADSKAAELRAACRRAIVGQFYCTALGAKHAYDFDDHDQRNIADAVTDGTGLFLSCTPEFSDDKRLRYHNATAVAEVFKAGVAHRGRCLAKLAELQEIVSRGSFNTIMAVRWPEELEQWQP